MSIEIKQEDVVRLILQFLRENNLQRTLHALQSESSVTFNTVDNKGTLMQDICQGRWDVVLRQIVKLKISPEKIAPLYEQIVLELAELGEISTAKSLLRQTEPMNVLKERDIDRYMALEELLSRSSFDAQLAYPDGSSKESRRHSIAQELATEIEAVPPSRLLALLGQSLKWQQNQGILPPDTPFDLFRGTVPVQKAEEDAVASQLYNTIKFPGKKAHAECAVFSPNGQYLATGTVDGFIEVWNYLTGKLRKDLSYQAEESLMAMDESILCLNFSRDSELLASGSVDGKIFVWKVQAGACQRKITPAHSQGVTSVCFNKDGTQVLSASYDQTVKLHGLRSGKTLKEFRGHSSFVNSALFSNDHTHVISASSDGTVKIWDAKTTNCLHTITPQPNPELSKTASVNTVASQTVQAIVPLPKNLDQVLVCVKSSHLYLMTMRGQIVKTFTHHKKTGADFVAAAVSPQGELVYGVGEDSVLYCFQASTAKLISETKVCEEDIIGLVGHPHSNTLATYDDAGHLYLFRS